MQTAQQSTWNRLTKTTLVCFNQLKTHSVDDVRNVLDQQLYFFFLVYKVALEWFLRNARGKISARKNARIVHLEVTWQYILADSPVPRCLESYVSLSTRLYPLSKFHSKQVKTVFANWFHLSLWSISLYVIYVALLAALHWFSALAIGPHY